ncbi:MAG: c-type cytochrome [Bacteroidales bacterium]
MKKLLPIALGLVLAAPALAADPSAPVSGSAAFLASNCFNCHGTDGKTTQAIPPLAGLEAGYIAEALKEYKDGSREATIMHQLAKGYTEEEIALISKYFATQQP